MSEILIGRGKAARVYKIETEPDHLILIRKEFSPIIHVKIWNRFFFESPHPLATEAGHRYAFWKRKLAKTLSRLSDCNVNISDAIQLSRNGFTSRYINGRLPTIKDRSIIYTVTRKLENFFKGIGMPTWSFSRRNPFSGSNFIIKDDKIHIIDYEQSVPVPDVKGIIGYDTVYFDDAHNFITNNKQRLLDSLGVSGLRELEKTFEMTRDCHEQLDIRPNRLTRLVNESKRKSLLWHF